MVLRERGDEEAGVGLAGDVLGLGDEAAGAGPADSGCCGHYCFLPLLTVAPELPGEEAQDGVAAQVVVVVQILVSPLGQADDALGHERGNGVFDEARIAVVGEAVGDAVEHAAVPPDLPEQQRPGAP